MKKILNFVKEIKYELGVFAVFIASRLPDLGYDLFNTDVWKWKARTYDFGSGIFYLDFIKTVQKYHPGVSLMWVGTIAVKFYNFFYELTNGTIPPDNDLATVFGLHFVQKLFVVMTIAAILALSFYALRKIFGIKYALISIFLLSLEPFYMALTRVVHLEGLMSAFMLASFAWLYYFLKDRSRLGRLAVSALMAGLAILTKTSALFIIPFSGLVLFLDLFVKDRDFGFALKTSLAEFARWLLLTVLFFIILWPAMWTHPQVALDALYKGIFTIGVERGHEQLFIYKWVLDPGLVFYPVVVLLESSLYLIVGLFGLTVFLVKDNNLDKKKFIFYALLFAVLYAVELTIPSKKLDRYIIPSILALLLAVAFFYEWILEKLNANFIVFFIIFAMPAVFTAYKLHPDYLSYYSPLGGGLEKGIFLIEPKWAFGQSELKEKLQELRAEGDFGVFESGESLKDSPSLEDRLIVALPEKYYTQLWPFVRQVGGWAVIQDLSPEARLAEYFIYPVWEDKAFLETRYVLVYKDSVYLRGVEIYRIYSRSDIR